MLKIAIVVHGRFHAFDLARALIARGNDVVVFTNYPASIVERFGIPRERVRSFLIHGLLSRLGGWFASRTGWSPESVLHPMFARWALRRLSREEWQVIHAWTGVAEEIYLDSRFQSVPKLIMRGSAHITTQARLLDEERLRVGQNVDHPSEWIMARELREYLLADRIIVLSRFAYNSFVDHGVAPERLYFLPLGTDVRAFRPSDKVAGERRRRIISNARLRVLYVGGVSWRKGLHDLCRMIELSDGRFEFRIVGPVWPEAEATAAHFKKRAEFISKRPQNELPQEYAWGDVFIFPTIEDGFAVVIAQAGAAGLPILTTPNCCGPDMIHEGRTGFILPIRSPEAFVDKLMWCDRNRLELAAMADSCSGEFQSRDWNDVAADFEGLCRAANPDANAGDHA